MVNKIGIYDADTTRKHCSTYKKCLIQVLLLLNINHLHLQHTPK